MDFFVIFCSYASKFIDGSVAGNAKKPGKKLSFMGNEIGQSREWNHDSGLDWHLLQYEKHKGIQALYKALNRLYASTPALHELDHEHQGFQWIDHGNAEQSIVSFVRYSRDKQQQVYVVSNFTPVPRTHFRLGVKQNSRLRLALNTDSQLFWGSDYATIEHVSSEPVAWNDCKESVEITLPPLATLFYVTE